MEASSTLNDLCSSIGAVNMDEEVNSESDPRKVEKTEHMWQLKMTSFSEQNLYLLKNKVRVDCTFVVGESPGEVQNFDLHRFVLSNASPVFDSMLYGDLAEKQDINIPDIEPQTFNHLVTYMYSGCLDMTTLSVELVVKLCYAAEKYMIVTLKSKCSDHLISVIDSTEIIRCWQLAIALHMTELAAKAREIVTGYTFQVLAAPTFQEQFNACSQDLVLELVQQPQLIIDSEFNLISAVLSWAQYQVHERDLADEPENYKMVLGPIFKHLRFFSLTPKEFAQLDSALSPVLTLDEKYSMAMQISLGDFSKIPDTLCQNVLKRKKIVIKVPKYLLLNDKTYTLLFKVDFNIEIHGLILPDIWKQLSVTVTRGENIFVPIGNNNVRNNASVLFLFKSPFIANANENYTILLSCDQQNNFLDPSGLLSCNAVFDIFYTQLVYSEKTNRLFVEHILNNNI